MQQIQIQDDLELLSLMMTDMDAWSELYKPTNYWQFYEKKFLPELHRKGLKDFRRRKYSTLTSMGATDLIPVLGEIDLHGIRVLNNRLTRHIPGWLQFLRKLSKGINRLLPINKRAGHFLMPYSIELADLRLLAYEIAKNAGEMSRYALPITQWQASVAGNPEDIFDVDGSRYTLSMLHYYMHYAYVSQTVDFNHLSSFVELGPGLGRQVEIIRKLHPHLTFYLFDIPPQLYVCEQYLKAVFPESVVSYRKTRELHTLPLDPKPGSIHLIGAGQFPLLEGAAFDVFWNAASFQEMEPGIVANYLRFVNHGARHIYLHQKEGATKAAKAGGRGVLEQTTFDHYRKNLSNFEMSDFRPSVGVLRRTHYKYYDSMWVNASK